MALNTQLVSLRLFLPLRQISHVCVENTTSSFPSSSPHVRRENTCFLVNLFLFVVAGANQKSSSHFHCLKCDYYCTDTNKVRRGCIFCAYSLVLQCNIVTHVARQQKVREGKRQRKDEDKLHFANWNWKLKQISPGGGAQEAASKAGQHHGCRWFFDLSSFLHTFAYFLLFTYLICAGFEKFTPTQYCSTPGCTHNGKQTHYHCRWTWLLFLEMKNQTCFTTKYHM